MLAVSGAGPANASDPLTFIGLIGRARLDRPEGVAAAASGDLYVAEPGAAVGTLSGNRLVKYSPDGTFLDVIAGTGVGVGQPLLLRQHEDEQEGDDDGTGVDDDGGGHEEWGRLEHRPSDAQYYPCGVWCALRLDD